MFIKYLVLELKQRENRRGKGGKLAVRGGEEKQRKERRKVFEKGNIFFA